MTTFVAETYVVKPENYQNSKHTKKNGKNSLQSGSKK